MNSRQPAKRFSYLRSVIAFLFIVSVAPSAWADDPTVIQQIIRAEMGLERYTLQEVDTTEMHLDRLEVPVKLGEQDVELVLEAYSVRAEGFRVRVQDEWGELVEVRPPEAKTYRGYIAGEPGSRAVACVYNGALNATITLDRDEEMSWVVKPLKAVADDAPAGMHLVYQAADVVPTHGTCALTGETVEAYESHEVQAEDSMDVFVCEIACDADYEFYVANANSVNDVVADIEMIIASVSDIYELDAGVTFELTEVIVRTAEPDPYSTNNPYALLTAVRNQWRDHHGDVTRDIVQLFTGRDLQGSPIGIADENMQCNGYSVVQSRFSTEWKERVAISAHEIGHNFDARHCDYGDAWCRIMCSAIGGCSEGYHSFCPSQAGWIRKAAERASCLTQDTVEVLHTQLPFADDFSYIGYFTPPDPNRWTALDRVDGSYGKVVIRGGRGYSSNQRLGTIRTRPMAAYGPAKISYRVGHNYVYSNQSLKVEYFNSTTWQWQLLETIYSQGGSTWTEHEHDLAVDGRGDHFAVRFSAYGTSLTGSYSWLLDDVYITPFELPADIDEDGKVDFLDYSILAAAYRTRDGQPHYNANADINEPPDGLIDLKDLAVLVESWLEGF